MTWGNPKRTNWNIPEDARSVQEDDSWTIYHSAAHACLYIYPASYHVQSLPLNAADLQRLLRILESSPSPPAPPDTTAAPSITPALDHTLT